MARHTRCKKISKVVATIVIPNPISFEKSFNVMITRVTAYVTVNPFDNIVTSLPIKLILPDKDKRQVQCNLGSLECP